VFSIAAAITTIVAAPTMIGIRSMTDTAPALGVAFARFTLWGVHVRGTAVALSFLGSLAALVVL
jgi:hypothetical protein